MCSVCDACGPSVYNKLKYEFKENLVILNLLRAYFDCDDMMRTLFMIMINVNRRYFEDDLRYSTSAVMDGIEFRFFTASVLEVA